MLVQLAIKPTPAGTAMSIPPHPAPNATAELCAACAHAKNCASCFEELLRRFQSPLLHFLIRRTRSRHDAEDLLQDSFLTVYRNLHRYNPALPFSTWLFTIANRLAISKSRRRKFLFFHAAPIHEPSTNIHPLADAQSAEMRSKLWDAAQSLLSPDAFTALWLHYVESMPANQIAQVLHRNPNATRILLHRARTRLAKNLGPSWQFSGVTT